MSTAPEPGLLIGAARTSRSERRPATWLERKAKTGLLERLEGIERGRLTLVDERGLRRELGPGGASEPRAELTVHDPAFYAAVGLRGSLGAGESFARGQWSSGDPAAVVRLVLRNDKALGDFDDGAARLVAPMLNLWHRLRDNTRTGSKRNIAAHYDLGNEFFALFLDDTWTYSSAIWPRPEASLEQAQAEKLDRACRSLELRPSDHLLEIGTGWGSFALHAAGEYGCRVTTTTISERQFELATERVRAAGLADRVTILKSDYRDLEGEYDALASIEMIEAVGARWLDTFFRTCAARLAPDGRMVLQAITIADQAWERQAKEADFIKRHVFPGSCLLSVETLAGCTARTPDLRMTALEDFTPHYARTLREWRERLDARLDEARALGCSEDLLRAWRWYFAYCEAGFAEGYLGLVQASFRRPEARRSPA